MGVDFYTCPICSYNYPDCGDYVNCEECGRNFCSAQCAQMKPFDENNEDFTNCCICRKEEASDDVLFKALLKHYNFTREDALKIWRDQK